MAQREYTDINVEDYLFLDEIAVESLDIHFPLYDVYERTSLL